MRTPGSRTTKTTTERDAPFGRLGPLPRGRGRVRGELRRKTVRWICSTALLLAAGHCALAAPEEKPRNPCHLDGAYVMGTLLEVRLCHENGARAAAMVIDQARQFDATFTTWADAGPVIELNRAAGSQWQSKDPDVLAILREALDWTAVTQGAFDVSVGPLIDVWQRAEQQDLPPRPEELGEALRHVGARHVDVSEDGVRLAAGTSVDLGGIAKGFALDRIAEDLRRHGIDRGLVDFGQSSLLALGSERSNCEILPSPSRRAMAGPSRLRARSTLTSSTLAPDHPSPSNAWRSSYRPTLRRPKPSALP
jgi:thiamine biosynthesis lipoprotein ApbE